MSSDEQKLDIGMSAAYRAWRERPDDSPDAGISISLTFTGPLAEIEALGFETHAVLDDEQALGVVRFKDIPALNEHQGVIWIAAGRAPKPDLDTAARDISARADMLTGGVPDGGVWHADVSSGALASIPKGTGKGVIVAIIDTGIDYTHPMFVIPGSLPRKTRIRRIWDQGLTPAAVTDCPPVQLLASAHTYGVEFDRNEIDAALGGGAALAHRDCDGHGTHVAGIAAGGTAFPLFFGDASKVGIAPEADIIAVKFLDTPDEVFYRMPDGSVGPAVGEAMKFRDAIVYCLRTARDVFDNQPVVINMSFGDKSKPGDALDEEARFVDTLLDPAASAGSFHFPKRAAVVKSMGNEGGSDHTQRVGRIEVPASAADPTSGEIVVPFLLVDSRNGSETLWQRCANEVYKPDMSLHFWYRDAPPPANSVKFAVRSPFGGAFSSEVAPNTTLAIGINATVGPPRKDDMVTAAATVHRITIEHKDVPGVRHPAGHIVKRNYVRVSVSPKESGGTFSYHAGIYEVRITAPSGTVLFVQGEYVDWNGGPMVFRMNDKLQNGTNRHTNIVALDDSSSVDSYGQQVLTVANYTDLADPHPIEPLAAHAISSTSSRGPIRDFSDPAQPPFCAKPDIAAPGHKINSALSRHTNTPFTWWPGWWLGNRFQELNGTSMAAPVVAGVVALLFEKKPDLSVIDVRKALFFAPRDAVNPPKTSPDAVKAYGVGMVDALSSHNKA